MKVLFMGTPDFACSSLQSLLDHHEVVAVVTQPDKQKGRGKQLAFPPVKELALENNIPVLQPIKIKDPLFVEELKKFHADIFIVVAYGQILSLDILTIPSYGCINVHGSLLPKYRGAGPIHRAIIDGETYTGITIMYMEQGLDTGDMIIKQALPISPNETTEELHDKMADLGGNLLLQALESIKNKTVVREKQNDLLSSYAPMLTKEMGHIQWNKSAKEILNLIRGLNPWPSAYTYYQNETIKIWEAKLASFPFNSAKPGEIIDANHKQGLIIATADVPLIITLLQGSNGKKMPASDYLRGHSLTIGTVLS